MTSKLKSRYGETYLLDARNGRVDGFSDWHDRIDATDSLVRGDFQVLYPDQSLSSGKPLVTNLADTMPRDVARLAAEVSPSFIAPAKGDSEAADLNAALRGVIGQGYFDTNRFDLMRPQLVMDLVITGTSFLAMWTDGSSDFPRLKRVDPRFCFPDVFNGEIQDLLVVHPIKLRVADRLFPDANLAEQARGYKDDQLNEQVEIWEYYGPGECVRGVSLMTRAGQPVGENGVTIIKRWDPGKNAPVSFGQLPSPDGAFRGLVDQIGPSLVAKNRAVSLALEYSHQMTWSPFEAKGILNSDTPPGPNTIYQHDPSATGDTFMRRVSPATSNQQLYGLIQFLDQEQRGQLNYPATRQGDIGVSQGSAAYVNSTMGSLTSLVRETQRILTDMQEQAGSIMFDLDERYLDYEKPLLHSVGTRRTYLPTKDIAGQHRLHVQYGAGAGLDRQNADVRILQFYSAGLISAEKALSEVDFVADARGAYEQRQDDEQERIILQRFAGDPSTSLDLLISALKKRRDNGGTFIDALVAAREEEQIAAQQAQEAAAAAGQTAQTGLTGEPAEPGAESEALQKGGIPGPAAPPIPGSFSPPPLQQVLIRGG
jgi:hypothetical protein